MTTIVATRDALYSDSKIVVGYSAFHGPKLFRVKGAIIATAGDCANGNLFIKWYGTKADKPMMRKKGAMEALVVSKKGISYFGKDCEEIVITDPFYAIGSGGDLALMAMRFYNATPEEAVRAACSTDTASGGEVQVMRLKGEVAVDA